MYSGFFIFLFFSVSPACCEKFQMISFNPNEPDDIINIISPEERFDLDCDDKYSTLDLSMTGIRKLEPRNVNNPRIKCLNLQGNEITDIPSDIFDSNHLANLTYLNLAYNYINLNNMSFLDGHQKLEALILDGNKGLYNNEYKPSAVLTHLEILYLRNNALFFNHYWQSLPFNIPRLSHLYLSDNNIDIQKYLRSPLESVTHLHLERNNFVFNSGYSYLNLKNVTHLFLDGNQFEHNQMLIDTNYMSSRSQLQLLSVKNCQIQNMKIDGYSNGNMLESLKTIDLSYNQLSSNSINFFAPLSLHNISLSHNLLITIPPSVMIESLKVISLSHNKINNITSECFKSCTNLRILSLRKNRISHIDADTFSALMNLQMLDLAENRFSSLPPYWIKKLYNLRYLNVNFNQFDSVEKLSIPRDHILENLHLRNNSIQSIMAKPLNMPLGLTIHVSPIS